MDSFDRFTVKSIVHSPYSPNALTSPTTALTSPAAPTSLTASASPAAPTSPAAPATPSTPTSPAAPTSPTALATPSTPTSPAAPDGPFSPTARTGNIAVTRNAASLANPTSPTAASVNTDAAPTIWAAPINSLLQEASVNNPDTSYNEGEVLNDFCDVITSIGSNKLSSKIVEPEVTPTVKPARGRGRPKKEIISLKAKPFKDDISAMLATSQEIKISKDIVICRSGSQGSSSAASEPRPQDLDRLRIKNMEVLSSSLKQGLKANIETNPPFKVTNKKNWRLKKSIKF